MIKTVEGFFGNGLKINHVVEVDFQDFPDLIDAVGGVTVNNKSKICSPEFDSFQGLQPEQGRAPARRADARWASPGCARTPVPRARTTWTAPPASSRCVSGLRGSLLRPASFFRLPIISWPAPKAIKSDMKGPGLLGLFTDLITGNSDEANVLKPDCLGYGPGGSLVDSEAEKANAVETLEGK